MLAITLYTPILLLHKDMHIRVCGVLWHLEKSLVDIINILKGVSTVVFTPMYTWYMPPPRPKGANMRPLTLIHTYPNFICTVRVPLGAILMAHLRHVILRFNIHPLLRDPWGIL